MCPTEVSGDDTVAVADHRVVSIPVGDGESMPATLHLGRNARSAVLLVADIRGPSPFYEALADRLAHVGIAVLLPDFFFRQGPVGAEKEDAFARRSALDERNTLIDLGTAADWLAAEFAVAKVGVLGFCMGGTFALDLASTRTDLVTVAYYGFPVPARAIVMPPPRPLDLVGSLTGPVLAFWGDEDAGVVQENVHEYIAAARGSNPEFDAEMLAGLGHGFLLRADLDDPSDAAAATWARTVQHFRTHLTARRGGGGGRGGGERGERGARGGGAPRVRLPRRSLEVRSIERRTSQLVRVRARGDLAGWQHGLPGAHVKIFVPEDGAESAAMRTYTVRRVEDGTGEIEIDFGLHADGPATRWAREVTRGSVFEVAGEARGGFAPKPATRWCVFFADHCALPAVGAIVEALPPHVTAIAVVELDDLADADPADSQARADWRWIPEEGEPGDALVRAAAQLQLPDGPGEIWVGCEAGAMRRIRRHLLDNRLIDRHRLHPRAYWKANVANHSDHDTGDD
ncbi:SIP domain-containing protein [Microbacterium allomyrinae]|uniref:Dienelactone hydrolase family protein n=1 Tax=Microbacterium allomyrinae TaxID=2830666 RepID=A0A9X1S3J4_9MICO|nr:SIP domain-containing protein [Microbacterium allomyrinae]MCC2033254.1 dienelactone hydrolase family protein [Microbacterium allomyrinae]